MVFVTFGVFFLNNFYLITNYKLRITIYELRITNLKLRFMKIFTIFTFYLLPITFLPFLFLITAYWHGKASSIFGYFLASP